MAKVIFYEGPMDRLLKDPNGPVGKMLARRSRKVLIAAKRQAGRKTGNLRANMHMRHARDSRGQYVKIEAKTPYALAHHEGTRPHRITANRAHFLKFEKRGQTIFRYSVMHPGTKANKYLTDNLRLVLLP